MRLRSLALIVGSLVFACTPAVEDSGPGPDGNGGGDDNTPPGATCALSGTYTQMPEQEAYTGIDDGSTYYELYSTLDAGELADELEVSLWSGYGAFLTAAVGPGTYTISGPETNGDDCGVCVRIFADVNPATDTEKQFYMAQSGTVTITSITGNMTGSLSNVVLKEADPNTYEPVAGGCEVSIPSATFDATLELDE